jgi:hypothetical protein
MILAIAIWSFLAVCGVLPILFAARSFCNPIQDPFAGAGVWTRTFGPSSAQSRIAFSSKETPARVTHKRGWGMLGCRAAGQARNTSPGVSSILKAWKFVWLFLGVLILFLRALFRNS